MNPFPARAGLLQVLATACLLACFAAGCTMTGPDAVHSGRIAYNNSIIDTDNQQILMVVIRNRYGERSNLLAVASVTASVRVTSNTGINLGFGADDSFSGNLVPFGAGIVYEENPTISYVPVGGEKYARRLMSPLPLATLAQLAGTRANPGPVYTTLISSFNGIRNPDFRHPAVTPDPRFSRVVSIMTELTRLHCLYWAQQPHREDRFSIILEHGTPACTTESSELLAVLGVPVPEDSHARVILPVSLVEHSRSDAGVGITTRSVFDLLDILSAAVEVPESEQASGVVTVYPPPGLAGKELRIHRSGSRPEQASVAVQYRDAWFYIDERDQANKGYFRLLATLLSATISEGAGGGSAPLLTLPVSR